ncbi:hypothetical protein C8R46DRAFT_1286261 [Mycena filopes]|nr:hypothetical protein C8R46DRAFT_1286261 [Mycena filopes]
MSLVAVPQDVLLELVEELDLVDLSNFLSVCRATRELQWAKSLWRHALVRMRDVERLPLPLPNVKQHDSMSRKELQDAAQRAVRLKKNLNSDKPMPVKIRTLSFDPQWHPIATRVCLPGSDIFVTHHIGFLSCWNIVTLNRVAHLGITGLRVMKDPKIEQDGRALFGAVIGNDQFAAIYIDYQEDPDQVSISYLTSPRTNTVDLNAEDRTFFVNSDTIGFCTSASTVYWSMDETAEVRVGPPFMPDAPRWPCCLLLGKNIYTRYPSSNIGSAHVKRHIFPPVTSLEDPTMWELCVPHPLNDEVQAPYYGVYAVELYAGGSLEFTAGRNPGTHPYYVKLT